MLRAGGRSPRGPESSGYPAFPALYGVVRIVLSTISRVNQSRNWAFAGSLDGMDVDVRAVDPHDESALAARHTGSAAALAPDMPDFPPPGPIRYAGQFRYHGRSMAVMSRLASLVIE